MNPENPITVEDILNAITDIVNNPETAQEQLGNFQHHRDIAQKLEKITRAIQKKYVKYSYLEEKIEKFNQVLLNYAQHDYSNQVDIEIEDDLIQSIAISINLLGEELNFSTVTKYYLEDIFNSIPDLLIVVDKEGFIYSVNHATTKALKFSREELLRQNIQTILEKGVKFRTLLDLKRLNQTINLISKSKNPVPVSINISSFVRGDNQEIGSVLIARDISLTLKYQHEIEQQNRIILAANEDLKVALRKAEESEKLKSAFLANMSHEIRTPLNGIMGFSELMQSPGQSIEELQNYGSIIFTCGTQLLGIVNNILDISKIEAGLMQISQTETNLNKILDDLYVVYKQKNDSLNKDIRIDVEKAFADDECQVMIDDLRLRQIMANLIDNALKFTLAGNITFGYRVTGDYIEFYVTDTGIGIPEDRQEDIFKPFMQADITTTRQFGGTGLGLAIATGLVKLQKGEIWLKSKPESGSSFFFSIPYIPLNKKKAVDEQRASLEKYIWNNRRILVVEDDPINAEYLKNILVPTGADLLYAVTGPEAIEKGTSGFKPEVILMDIRLPEIDGLQATRKIREVNTKVPIIAQTAHASPEDKVKCIEAGCDDYVTKPINSRELLGMINRYL